MPFHSAAAGSEVYGLASAPSSRGDGHGYYERNEYCWHLKRPYEAPASGLSGLDTELSVSTLNKSAYQPSTL